MVWRRRAAMAGRLVVFLCRESSGRFGSSKLGRGLATKLHPHLIELGKYVGTEVEQQKRIEAREQIEGEAQGAIGSERLIDGVAVGGGRRAAMAGRLVLLSRQPSGRFGSSKLGRGLATKLHPLLIGLGQYVGTDVEQQRQESR